MERRAHQRVEANFTAKVAVVSERIPPDVAVIDVSSGGALVAFGEPIGFVTDERVVVMLQSPPGPIHLLGRVVRNARGADFRTYVAIQFEDDQSGEIERLDDVIAHRLAERENA